MVEKGVQIPKTKSVWEAMNGLIKNPKRVRMKQTKTENVFTTTSGGFVIAVRNNYLIESK